MAEAILRVSEDDFWIIETGDFEYDVYYPLQKGIADKSLAEKFLRGLRAENNY